MRRRMLGKTGFEVSELGVGTWGLSGEGYGAVAREEVPRVVKRALMMGISLFDTTPSYAGGAIEEILGECIGPQHSAHVVIRYGTDTSGSLPIKNFHPKFLLNQMTQSRKRLGKEAKLIGLLHHPTLATAQGSAASEALEKARNEGLLDAWGVSTSSAEVALAAI
ncbi:MAG: aldo/keto reductase, partial [Polyangiaceae bacterium]|nr:aldo/keto reductase [Polyangiaceae bacterium]